MGAPKDILINGPVGKIIRMSFSKNNLRKMSSITFSLHSKSSFCREMKNHNRHNFSQRNDP